MKGANFVLYDVLKMAESPLDTNRVRLRFDKFKYFEIVSYTIRVAVRDR